MNRWENHVAGYEPSSNIKNRQLEDGTYIAPFNPPKIKDEASVEKLLIADSSKKLTDAKLHDLITIELGIGMAKYFDLDTSDDDKWEFNISLDKLEDNTEFRTFENLKSSLDEANSRLNAGLNNEIKTRVNEDLEDWKYDSSSTGLTYKVSAILLAYKDSLTPEGQNAAKKAKDELERLERVKKIMNNDESVYMFLKGYWEEEDLRFWKPKKGLKFSEMLDHLPVRILRRIRKSLIKKD
jgi:hypothetical protein